MNSRRIASILPVLGVAFAAGFAHAQSPFQVTVTSSTLPTLQAGASSFPDLLSDVLKANNDFSRYTATDFRASFSFLGVANAVTATSNASGTAVQIQIPGIGFSRTWTGPSRDAVEKEV
jgi:hypothetical protein